MINRRVVLAPVLCALVVLAGGAADAQAPDRPEPGRGEASPTAQAPQQGGLLGGVSPPATPPDPGSPPTGGRQVGVRAPGASAGAAVVAPRVSTRPILDGLLDDEVWAQAVRIADFVQRNPAEGAPVTA